jgi:hypothetical protein
MSGLGVFCITLAKIARRVKKFLSTALCKILPRSNGTEVGPNQEIKMTMRSSCLRGKNRA